MFAVLCLALVAAQDPTTPARLTLADVYREGRAANPRILAADALAAAVRARADQAKLPPDPQLQFGFMNYELPRLAPMDQLGMAQAQLMQMVPTAGKLGLAGQVASARAGAATERVSETGWDVHARLATAFYDLYATDRGLDVARETLRLLQDLLRTAESMYRVGEGRQADVLRAQVEISRMIEDTVRMTAMRAASGARLNALLNRPTGVSVASPVLPGFPDSLPSADALVAIALAGRPMLKAGSSDVAAADAEARLARREIWPDLVVGIQYGQRRGMTGGTDRMGSLMLGAALPVFAAKRQLRMRQESAAMRRMAEADLDAMRADTRALVLESHADLVRARHLAAAYRTTIIPQAQAALESAFAAYRVGRVDFMTLLDNSMTTKRFRQDLAALEADEGKAWAELEMLLGQDLVGASRVADAARAGAREK